MGVRLEDLSDDLRIHTDRVANRPNLVGKCNLQGMKCVAAVLDHFRSRNRSFIQTSWQESVQVTDWSCLDRISRADNSERRIEEISHSRSFAQKFRVKADPKVLSRRHATGGFDRRHNHALRGAWQHGAAN